MNSETYKIIKAQWHIDDNAKAAQQLLHEHGYTETLDKILAIYAYLDDEMTLVFLNDFRNKTGNYDATLDDMQRYLVKQTNEMDALWEETIQ